MSADLEITIYKTEGNFYGVTLTFENPEQSDANGSAEGASEFHLGEFLAAQISREQYGQKLTEFVFPLNSPVRNLFIAATGAVAATGQQARVRLFITRRAVELQTLRWETLQHPATSETLATSEHYLFSRYLYSREFKPVKLRPKGQLRALLAVSALSHSSRATFGLAEIDADAEINRVTTALTDIFCDSIGATGSALDLDHLLSTLRNQDREYDILYLIGHGSSGPPSALFIERNEKDIDPLVTADELVTRFGELLKLPRLVVLASCQSGRDLTALGPRLVEAGVPAVVGMQGNVSLETLGTFIGRFFRELAVDGRVDLATAVARGSVRNNVDGWMPVLFSRLREGRIWFEAGFARSLNAQEPANWPIIISKARNQEILPIIGPGVGEGIYGDVRDLARTIARYVEKACHVRVTDSLGEREGLAQVCQTALAYFHDRSAFQNCLFDALKSQILKYHNELVGGSLMNASAGELLEKVGSSLRQTNAQDAYRLLAQLKVPCFINANYDNCLVHALSESGRNPVQISCHWRDGTARKGTLAKIRAPTVDAPIVYHVFGTFDDLENIVLTEDRFFQYLIRTTTDQKIIPYYIRSAEVTNSLAILGFQITDWNFRVLLHSILGQEGSSRLRELTHVAVQLDRNDESPVGYQLQAEYLKELLGDLAARAQIFWGGPEHFLSRLLNDLSG